MLKIRWIRIEDKDCGMSVSPIGFISRFQRFNRGENTLFLERCPRLSHCAPLAHQYKIICARSVKPEGLIAHTEIKVSERQRREM